VMETMEWEGKNDIEHVLRHPYRNSSAAPWMPIFAEIVRYLAPRLTMFHIWPQFNSHVPVGGQSLTPLDNIVPTAVGLTKQELGSKTRVLHDLLLERIILKGIRSHDSHRAVRMRGWQAEVSAYTKADPYHRPQPMYGWIPDQMPLPRVTDRLLAQAMQDSNFLEHRTFPPELSAKILGEFLRGHLPDETTGAMPLTGDMLRARLMPPPLPIRKLKGRALEEEGASSSGGAKVQRLGEEEGDPMEE
jgi:hypothetical protein